MTIEPVASRPTPDWLGGKELLPWSWAVEHLTAERNYWVVTVRRDGFPQARPVWGVWDGHGLFLSVGHGGLQRTARQPAMPITVHTDSAVDVVILEGIVDRVAPHRSGQTQELTFEIDAVTRREVVERYNQKYAWDFEPDGDDLNFLVRPTRAYGWRDEDVKTGTKWTFPPL